ncbi:unnamed protein product [Symbiodinium microadriaticum]|nr:unnamed protein product [Symbiodinium microadriaticum]CAE7360435.1 unnamed protein product [Symbiodinium sp. KB8]
MAPLAGEALSRRHSCIGLSVLGVWLAWWLAEPGGPAGNAALAFSPVYSAKVLKAMQKVRAPRKGRIPRKRTLDGKPGRTMTASKAGRKAFLMKRLGDPKIKVSELQQVAKELLGMITDHRDFSIAIGVLSRRRQHDLMFKMIDDMDERLGPNVVTYSVAIKGLSGSGHWALGTQLLKQLDDRAKGGPDSPNVITYNTVITALARAKQWEGALGVLEELTSRQLNPTESTYSAAMTACRGAQQWRTALGLNEDMLNSGLRGNLLTWTCLIQAMESAEPVLAVRSYGRMKRAGFQADEQVYDAVLRACAAGGLWKRAIFIINSMIQAGLTPSASAYSSAIAACSSGEGRRSIDLFAEMLSKDLSPTPAAYVGVMTAYEKEGDFEMVLKTFEDMKAQPGCRLTYAAFAAAMRAHASLQQPEDSDTQRRGAARKQLTLFDQMSARHRTQPDAECHSLAAQAHATCYEAMKGVRVLEQAIKNELTPSGVACQNVLDGLENSRDGEASEDQYKMLYEAGIRGYLPDGEQSARLLKQMTEAGYSACQDIYERIVRESNSPEVATATYEDLKVLQMEAAPETEVAAMSAFVDQATWARALEIFEDLRVKGSLAPKGRSLDLLDAAGLAALRACAAGGKCQEALNVIEQLRFRGLVLSPALYEAAIAAAIGGFQLETAKDLLFKMKGAGYEPSPAVLKSCQLESYVEQVQEAERQGVLPEEAMLEKAIREAKEVGDLEMARDLTLQLRIAKTGVDEQRWNRLK